MTRLVYVSCGRCSDIRLPVPCQSHRPFLVPHSLFLICIKWTHMRPKLLHIFGWHLILGVSTPGVVGTNWISGQIYPFYQRKELHTWHNQHTSHSDLQHSSTCNETRGKNCDCCLISVVLLALIRITWKSRDSSVGIAIGVRFPAGAGNFYLNHRVQNGSGAHPASYPMGTRGSFPGCKAAGAWSWPLTSI
jgi:hypothetical protein